MKNEKDKNRKKKGSVIYVLGSVGLTVVAFAMIPKVIEWGATKLCNDDQNKILDDDSDDWGPEIVRKTSAKEGGDK